MSGAPQRRLAVFGKRPTVLLIHCGRRPAEPASRQAQMTPPWNGAASYPAFSSNKGILIVVRPRDERFSRLARSTNTKRHHGQRGQAEQSTEFKDPIHTMDEGGVEVSNCSQTREVVDTAVHSSVCRTP